MLIHCNPFCGHWVQYCCLVPSTHFSRWGLQPDVIVEHKYYDMLSVKHWATTIHKCAVGLTCMYGLCDTVCLGFEILRKHNTSKWSQPIYQERWAILNAWKIKVGSNTWDYAFILLQLRKVMIWLRFLWAVMLVHWIQHVLTSLWGSFTIMIVIFSIRAVKVVKLFFRLLKQYVLLWDIFCKFSEPFNAVLHMTDTWTWHSPEIERELKPVSHI